MTNDAALIELVSVSKDYTSGAGVVCAMRDVSLRIGQGEFVAIVGASGSGKSTMMNILGCLDRPTRGSYALAGLDAGGRGNDARALVRNRIIGFVFQGFNLLPRTTALENVELPLSYRGVRARMRRRRATKALEQVGLADRAHHKPNQLSGGEQQRVAIARALVSAPLLLLADEPTGNLDTRTSLEVLALLQKLNRQEGITIVLVTHEQDIAACASRVLTMRDGRIVRDVLQPNPIEAIVELARLPPAPAAQNGSSARAELDPLEERRQRIGGSVPIGLYAMMLLGGLLGFAAGAAYDMIVLGQWLWTIAFATMFLGEAWLGARYSRKKLGRSLTGDQTVRASLWYSSGFLALAFGIAWSVLPKLRGAPNLWLERLLSHGLGLGLATVVLVAGALALLRCLLLSLFTLRRA